MMVQYIKEFDIKIALLIFIGYIIIDYLYADYIVSVSNKQPLRSAILSAIIYSMLAMGVVTYSKNPLYILPLAAGAFIGTYLLVKCRK